jgi:hypothetical protein
MDLQRTPAVVCSEWMGEWVNVPISVAKCPECGAQLKAWVDGWSEGSGYSVILDCTQDENEENLTHQCCQGDWQPVLDVVTAWANSPINGDKLP